MKLVTTATQKKSLLRTYRRVVLYYTADWCGPCKRLSPLVSEMDSKNRSVVFAKIKIDHYDGADADQVHSVPTLRFYHNGTLISSVNGANPSAVEASLQNLLDAH